MCVWNTVDQTPTAIVITLLRWDRKGETCDSERETHERLLCSRDICSFCGGGGVVSPCFCSQHRKRYKANKTYLPSSSSNPVLCPPPLPHDLHFHSRGSLTRLPGTEGHCHGKELDFSLSEGPSLSALPKTAATLSSDTALVLFPMCSPPPDIGRVIAARFPY